MTSGVSSMFLTPMTFLVGTGSPARTDLSGGCRVTDIPTGMMCLFD